MFNISKILISFFGLGFIKYAPGTFGSFFIIIFFYLLMDFLSSFILILIFFFIFIISIKMINIYSYKKKVHDSPEIIIDELLGILLIIIFYDYIKFTNDPVMFFLIFIFFRFFDILKIFPANWIDKNIKNSFGVILDDIVAGVYCIISLYLINVLY